MPRAGSSATTRVEASAAPTRVPREALRRAHTPVKWLAAEEGAQGHFRLSTFIFLRFWPESKCLFVAVG